MEKCDVHRVARQCGIKLKDGHEHSPTSRKPLECFCKPTLREIGQEHGEGHLRLVLRLMTGDSKNQYELYADTIKAMSSVIAWNPDLEDRVNLTDEINAIDLGSLRRRAKSLKCDVSRTDAMKVMLAMMLYPSWRGDREAA